MITFEKVTKKFRTGKIGLSSINLTIESGEFVFIVGPSGAGKTTLLRLVIRDLVPTEGEIVVNNWKLSQMRSWQVDNLRRLTGMIFQDFKILSDRTAFENISLPLEILGKGKDEIERKVLQALDIVGLVDKAQHFPIQFSAGELQRIALARAVVASPKIILADEPTGNLDPKTSWEIIDNLKKIHKKGHTVVVATHDQDIVNSLQERVISLNNGKVIKDLKKGKYL